MLLFFSLAFRGTLLRVGILAGLEEGFQREATPSHLKDPILICAGTPDLPTSFFVSVFLYRQAVAALAYGRGIAYGSFYGKV